MMRAARWFCGLVLLALAGCAPAPSGPSVLEIFPPLPAGDGRIVVYRDVDIYQSLQWIPVTFNGRQVGAAGPGAVFFRDVAPGTYEIDVVSQTLWPDRAKTVKVGTGQTVYAKIEVFRSPASSDTSEVVGPVFVVAIMAPAFARREIDFLHAAR